MRLSFGLRGGKPMATQGKNGGYRFRCWLIFSSQGGGYEKRLGGLRDKRPRDHLRFLTKIHFLAKIHHLV